MSFIIKTLCSSMLIALSTEVAKKNPAWGGLILALPLASIIAFIFMGTQGASTSQFEVYAKSMFIFVPISLVFFIPFIIPFTQNWHFLLKIFSGILILTLLNIIAIKLKLIEF